MSFIKHVAVYLELDHAEQAELHLSELHLWCTVCSRYFNAFAKLVTATKAQPVLIPIYHLSLSLIPIYHPALSDSHLSSRSL